MAGARLVQVRRPDKVLLSARVDGEFVGGGGGPDLALVDIDDDGIDLAAIELAVVDRDSPMATPVEDCHAVGYPWFAETRSPSVRRDTVDAWGHIPVLSKLTRGLLTVQVTDSPRPLPPERAALGESEWSGMSGAPVVAGECLLGVVSEHAPREGPSAITAVPLSALEPDPAHPDWGPGVSNAGRWWARLGVSGLEGLRRLPERKVRLEPAYRATVREIHGRTPKLLGRERELAELANFATGPEGYRWLTGGAWAGKTALAAELCTAALPPSVDVVAYFLSRRGSDADSRRFLATVVPQLAYLIDEDPPVPSLEQFWALFGRATDRAVEAGRHLLLVVDGLDEDLRPVKTPSVASQLPGALRANAHVLVTSRPYPELPSDVPVGHLLLTTPPMELTPSPHAQQLADLARKEIKNLLDGEDEDLAAEVLGVLTAAAGPLALDDLVTLAGDLPAAIAPAWSRRVERLVTVKAARTVQPVGPANGHRYQFAHGSLLEQAQTDPRLRSLRNPDYRRRIDRWADQWRDAGWPTPAGQEGTTPRYLLDTYTATLENQPEQFAALASDLGWVTAALQTVGVDIVLADLATAQSAGAAAAGASALLAVLRSQAPNLRAWQPIGQPGYVLRQVCLQAAEFGEDRLADDARARLQTLPSPCLVPLWTTRRASRALSVEFGVQVGQVAALAVLPDGRVVSGASDWRVRVWDPKAPGAGPIKLGGQISPGAGPALLGIHYEHVTGLAVLPDGRVASGSGDGRVRLWDPEAPGADPVELGVHDGYVAAVAALPDGRVVTGGEDWRVRVWDPEAPDTGPVELGGHDGPVRVVTVLPDGRVASIGSDVRVWDPVAPGTGPVELSGLDGRVTAVAVLPDGRVVSGDGDGRLRVWSPAAPGAGPVELGSHDDPVAAVAVLPDGRVVSCSSRGGRANDWPVLLWDPAAPGALPLKLGSHDGPVAAVAVLPDGRVVSGGSDDGRVRVWDPAVAGARIPELGSHDGPVTAVAMLPDGKVVTGGEVAWLRIWDPAVPDAGPVELRGHAWGPVSAVAVLPDGRIVSGGFDCRMLVWNPARTRRRPVELGSHDNWVTAVAVLPDGRVVSAGGQDGWVRVWDPGAPGAGPVQLGAHGWTVRPIGQVKPEPYDDRVGTVAALPDGRVVSAGGGDGRVRVWDPATPGAGPVELGSDERVTAVAALPDGRVVSGGWDGRVRVRDPAAPEGAPVELGGHDGPVQVVTVLPDGRVVSGGDDEQVRVWDVARATEIARAVCSVRAAAIAPGSARDELLLTAHAGQGVTMWSVCISTA